jgi:hypothetical protein
LGNGGAGESDGGHGGGLVIDKAVVGDLNSAAIIIHGFIRVLLKICKVGANSFCGVFWLEGVEKLLLDIVPDGEVNVVISEGLPPDDGTVPEAKFEFPDLAGLIPGGDGGGILDSIDKNLGKNGVFLSTGIKQRNICGPPHTVMVVKGLGDVGHVEIGSGGEGLSVLFIERRLRG